MNLGVETKMSFWQKLLNKLVSAFSDESWGGDLKVVDVHISVRIAFQHSLMNLGVETILCTGNLGY